MPCDGCERAREEGSRFCPECGSPLNDCPRCESARLEGSVFCPKCGRHLAKPPEQKSILSLAATVATALVLILLVMELAYMVVGIPGTWSGAANLEMDILLLIPTLVSVGTLSGIPLQLFWILLVTVILVSAVVVLRDSIPTFIDPRKRTEAEKTSLHWISVLMCVSLLISMLLALMTVADTEIPELPSGMSAEALLSYANAAVWEEVISRMAYIGIPMLVLGVACKKRNSWRYLLGGFGMSRVAMVLIFISALVFGFAHMSGWGLWKVLPTFISGIMMGYLFVRFGVHASITFHFITDYMSVLVTGAAMAITSIIVLVMLVAGLVLLIYIAKKIVDSKDYLESMPGIMPPDQESIFFKDD